MIQRWCRYFFADAVNFSMIFYFLYGTWVITVSHCFSDELRMFLQWRNEEITNGQQGWQWFVAGWADYTRWGSSPWFWRYTSAPSASRESQLGAWVSRLWCFGSRAHTHCLVIGCCPMTCIWWQMTSRDDSGCQCSPTWLGCLCLWSAFAGWKGDSVLKDEERFLADTFKCHDGVEMVQDLNVRKIQESINCIFSRNQNKMSLHMAEKKQ